MTEYLFIGGKADGKRIDVDVDAEFVRVPIAGEWCGNCVAVEEYGRISFRIIDGYGDVTTSDVRFDIFVPHGTSHGQAFRMLVEKYPRPQ